MSFVTACFRVINDDALVIFFQCFWAQKIVANIWVDFDIELKGTRKSSYDNNCSLILLWMFQVLLHFIYWDALPDMEELLGLSSNWASAQTTLMAQHLLAAADRYALERLKVLCEAKLCENVAINNVATTLALAEQHHCFQLKAVCLKFIAVPENLRGNYFLY